VGPFDDPSPSPPSATVVPVFRSPRRGTWERAGLVQERCRNRFRFGLDAAARADGVSVRATGWKRACHEDRVSGRVEWEAASDLSIILAHEQIS
jgi:hypothetical protein